MRAAMSLAPSSPSLGLSPRSMRERVGSAGSSSRSADGVRPHPRREREVSAGHIRRGARLGGMKVGAIVTQPDEGDDVDEVDVDDADAGDVRLAAGG